MENNILKVVFGADRTSMENYARSTPLWQYDYGQKLLIEGVTLPMAYEVHFSNKRHGDSVTVIGDDTGVDIPDEMLLSGQDVYAWVYLHSTENDGETEYMVTIPVSKRAKPTNETPTPVQQDVITQAIAAMQAAVAKSETNVEHYPCIIDGYWYVWNANENAFVNTGVSGHGEKGDTGNGIARIEFNADYTITFYFTNGTNYTTGSVRGEPGPKGDQGPKGDKGDKGDPGKPMDIIDDTAGAGETERAWSADKLVTELGTKADKTDTVLETTLSRGRKANSTTGTGSSAFGNDVEASGAYSHAEGEWATALGEASHAEGTSTRTEANSAHAEGEWTTAHGTASHAEGKYTLSDSAFSHAEGYGSQSKGESSHAEGNYTKATSNYAHSEGNNTTASGSSSHAEGYKTTASNSYAHAEGDNTTASGQSSHAEGVRTEAAGLGSHAEGYYSKSTGQYAHTEGARGDIASKMYNGVLYVVGASGVRSHAEGLGGIAAGTEAHAEGNGTYAIGNDSHAEGIETKAIGYSSHAEGSYTTAKAMHSHAEGYSTIASGNYSHVSGKHNVEDLNNQYVEIIGNGTGNATRSNARTLDWNGNEHLRGDIYVQCNPDGTGGIKIDPSGGGDVSNKADKTDTVLLTTLSRGRKENTTVGTASFAFGDNVTASGQASHAEGTGTVASALQAHAEGCGTTASGVNSHAEGLNTYASGAHAHTEGGGTSASGDYSHAEGAASQATSSTAHAEGSGTRASGGSSHAEGGGSVASGIYSHAEGAGTVASGSQAHAEGSGTQANGNHSHAEGQATKANAKESHAEGHYTVAAGEASHVFGKYNVADNYSDYPEWVSGTSYAVGDLVKVTTVVSGVTTVKGYKCYTANSDTTFDDYKWEQYDYLHYVEIVGNGEGPNEYASNARTLDWEGNERLMGDIYVGCNSDGTGGTNLRRAINTITPSEYSSSSTYEVGDLCWHENAMYRCNTVISTAEAWTVAHWTQIAFPRDVRVNGTTIVDANGVANMPVASASNLGVAKVRYTNDGLWINSDDNTLRLYPALASDIKAASANYRPITPATQHNSVFYGLAKAAGDTSQASSANEVGTYTEDAKSSIHQMLDAPVSVSGSTPSITAKAGVRYVCGEVSTLTIVVPASGCIDVTFESGSTATVLTITPPTGQTVKWANGFDPTSLEANTTYELNILDGEYGVVGSWT